MRLHISDWHDLYEQIDQSEASFKRMLILDPALYHLRVAEWYARDNFGTEAAKDPFTIRSGWPLTIDEFLLHANWFINHECESVDFGDSGNWLVIGNGVDEITGYRMLEMLDANQEAVSTASPSSTVASSETQISFGSNAKWLYGEG